MTFRRAPIAVHRAAAFVAMLLVAHHPAMAASPFGATADDIVRTFGNAATTMTDTSLGMAQTLFFILIGIEVTWTLFEFALKKDDFADLITSMTWKALSVSCFILFVQSAVAFPGGGPGWFPVIINSFITAGQVVAQAGGASLGGGDPLPGVGGTSLSVPVTPGNILDQGGNAAMLLMGVSGQVAGAANPIVSPGAWSNNLVMALFVVIAAVAVFLAYLIVAGIFLITLIESYVLGTKLFLLGFAGHRSTTQYAMPLVGLAMSIGVKLFALEIVLGLGNALIGSYVTSLRDAITATQPGVPPNISVQLSLIGVVGLWLFIVVKAPQLAASALSGSPALSLGDVNDFARGGREKVAGSLSSAGLGVLAGSSNRSLAAGAAQAVLTGGVAGVAAFAATRAVSSVMPKVAAPEKSGSGRDGRDSSGKDGRDASGRDARSGISQAGRDARGSFTKSAAGAETKQFTADAKRAAGAQQMGASDATAAGEAQQTVGRGGSTADAGETGGERVADVGSAGGQSGAESTMNSMSAPSGDGGTLGTTVNSVVGTSGATSSGASVAASGGGPAEIADAGSEAADASPTLRSGSSVKSTARSVVGGAAAGSAAAASGRVRFGRRVVAKNPPGKFAAQPARGGSGNSVASAGPNSATSATGAPYASAADTPTASGSDAARTGAEDAGTMHAAAFTEAIDPLVRAQQETNRLLRGLGEQFHSVPVSSAQSAPSSTDLRTAEQQIKGSDQLSISDLVAAMSGNAPTVDGKLMSWRQAGKHAPHLISHVDKGAQPAAPAMHLDHHRG